MKHGVTPCFVCGLFYLWAVGLVVFFPLLFYWTTEGLSLLDDCVLWLDCFLSVPGSRVTSYFSEMGSPQRIALEEQSQQRTEMLRAERFAFVQAVAPFILTALSSELRGKGRCRQSFKAKVYLFEKLSWGMAGASPRGFSMKGCFIPCARADSNSLSLKQIEINTVHLTVRRRLFWIQWGI